jgi:ESCRT-I complex subunit VPS28
LPVAFADENEHAQEKRLKTPSVRRLLSAGASLAGREKRCVRPTDAGMNLDEEVRLYATAAERERTENLATLYSIIVSVEYLERAYVRDSVSSKE